MTIDERQQEIIDEFAPISNWQDRYRKIIQIGRDLEDLDEAHKTEKNLVKGCQNRAWLHAELDDEGQVVYAADSEAMIVRGFVAMFLRIFSEQDPDAIIEAQPRFIDELGIGDNISLNRANGLASMIKQIKLYALALKAVKERQAQA